MPNDYCLAIWWGSRKMLMCRVSDKLILIQGFPVLCRILWLYSIMWAWAL